MKDLITAKTAILIFARTVSSELAHKRFFASKNFHLENEAAKALYQQTLNVCSSTDLPIEIVSSAIQEGDDFGERFHHAIKSTFRKGYHNIICVGSDTPDLNAEHISQAQSTLSNGCPVLGEAKDGGVFLLGISREDFDILDFKSIKWQTNTVYQSLAEQLASAYTLNDVLVDIDHWSSLTHYATYGLSGIQRLFCRLLSSFQRKKLYLDESLCSSFTSVSLPLRAPPVY